jgi:DNA-binding NarL/FixJ family response regulator
VLIDDEDGRRRLSSLLDGDPTLDVVGQCPPADAVAVVHQEQPDAALIGLDRELHALEVLSPIRSHTPACRLVVLTDLVDPWTLTEVLERGAHLLIDEDADVVHLSRILDQVDDELPGAEAEAAVEAAVDAAWTDELEKRRVARHRHPRVRSWFHASIAAAALVAAAMGVARVGGSASVPAEAAYQRVLIGT